jgi:hypothetical protein
MPRVTGFRLLTFSSSEVRERGLYLGETRLTVGEATWKVSAWPSVVSGWWCSIHNTGAESR